MDFEAGNPAGSSPPLEGVGRVYEAYARSLEEVSGTDGPVAVEIPEEFRPIPLDEGLQALREQTQELCRLGFALRNSLADLLYASIGTELGEYHRTGEARPNPELAGKLRETSHALQGCLALSVQAAWLLRHYRCLPEFLKLAVTPTADLHPDWRPPELGQPVPLTDPGLPAELGIPPLSRPLDDMARQLGENTRPPQQAETHLPEVTGIPPPPALRRGHATRLGPRREGDAGGRRPGPGRPLSDHRPHRAGGGRPHRVGGPGPGTASAGQSCRDHCLPAAGRRVEHCGVFVQPAQTGRTRDRPPAARLNAHGRPTKVRPG